MNNQEYKTTQDTIIILYQMLAVYDLDLDGFLERINYADAVAPILDPTAYMRGVDNMHQIKAMALALKPAVELVKQLRLERNLDEDEARCRVCGCTDDHACAGGCYWVEKDLCSACVDRVVGEE